MGVTSWDVDGINFVLTKVRRHSGNITEGTGWVSIAPQLEATEAHCLGPLACLPWPPLQGKEA